MKLVTVFDDVLSFHKQYTPTLKLTQSISPIILSSCSNSMINFTTMTAKECWYNARSILQVIDLLLTMARTACLSNRKELIMDPYPSVVDPENPNRLIFDPKVSAWKSRSCFLIHLNLHV